MPILVEEMTSEVAVFDGEVPLTQEQLDKLVRLVIQRLENKGLEAKRRREATELRRHAAAPFDIGS
jgi:hypothetical protein